MTVGTYYIRCDSSVIIGSGHVMRCLNIARKLSNKNLEVIFIVRSLPGSLHSRIEGAGYKVILIPIENGDSDYKITQAADAKSVLDIIPSENKSTVIVDHYALTKEWQTYIKGRARVVVIDDLADRPHDCDIIINHNYYSQGIELYKDLLPEDTQLLLGPSYALIADDFSIARKKPAKPKDDDQRVVVFFGASDPSNLTGIATVAAIKSKRFRKIDIVAGENHPDRQALEELSLTHEDVTLHSFIVNFADFLSNADLMIGAGGVTQLERCCLGIPGIIISIADNQCAVSQNLHNKGCAIYLGSHENVSLEDLLHAIDRFYHTPASREAMSSLCLNLVDGLGVSRVISLLKAPRLQLRHARISDGEVIYSWRNHPLVREYSGNTESIPLDTHLDWLEKTLKDKDRVLLISETDDIPNGVLRFDFKQENAVVSLYLDPQSIGHGIGYALLEMGRQWLRKHYPQIKVLQAVVHDNNVRSLKIFAKAGYSKQGDFYKLKI